MLFHPRREYPRLEWNRATSVHIGLNRLDETVYERLLPELRASEADARAMLDVANTMGAATRLLLSEEATRDRVRVELVSAIDRLMPGDTMLVSFAGHMVGLGSVGDDPDGSDEGWCLFDGVLLDDEFTDVLAQAPADSDLVIVTDACLAGGIVDGPGTGLPRRSTRRGPLGIVSPTPATFTPPPNALSPFVRNKALTGPGVTVRGAGRAADYAVAARVRAGSIPSGGRARDARPAPLKARVVSLAAASESSLAFEGDKHGLFTAALLHTLQEATRRVTYAELRDEVADLVRIQTPALTIHGSATPSSLDESAFAPGSQPRPIGEAKRRPVR